MSAETSGSEVTIALELWRAGDRAAFDRLVGLLYAELKRSAHGVRSRFGGRRAPLETTVLLHETYLRLARSTPGGIASREHFLAVACHAMRQLLVDELRRRGRGKRGAGVEPVTLSESMPSSLATRPELFLDLDRAMDELGKERPRLLQVLECRLFGGMSDEEIGTAMGASSRTIHRDWVKARAWLQLQLDPWKEGCSAG